MTPKLTELIDRAATLTPQERLELLTYLQATPDRPELWDLSPEAIASRNTEMRKVLAEWREQGDETEQTETWEELQVSLVGEASPLENRDRLSSNRPFFPLNE